ncbi:MAG: Clp protease N-terminal domain-containing protein [Myxococcaceae bacterium]
MATPLIAKELQASFRQALTKAKAMRHERLTLEHLLLELTHEPKTEKILVDRGANVSRLRQRLENFLAETLDRVPDSIKAEPQQTIGIEPVLQQATQVSVTREVWGWKSEDGGLRFRSRRQPPVDG